MPYLCITIFIILNSSIDMFVAFNIMFDIALICFLAGETSFLKLVELIGSIKYAVKGLMLIQRALVLIGLERHLSSINLKSCLSQQPFSKSSETYFLICCIVTVTAIFVFSCVLCFDHFYLKNTLGFILRKQFYSHLQDLY